MSASGSFSEINARIGEVRSTPADGHHQPVYLSPKSAISRLMHRSIEGIAEFSLGGTELGALLVCETDFGGTPATIARRD